MWRCRGGLTPGRGRDRGKPVLGVPLGAPAHMGELDHQLAAVPVHAVGELAEEGDHRIVGDRDLVPGRGRAVHGDRGGAAEHGEPDAAPRLLGVIELVALLRLAVPSVAGRVARGHHPISDGQALDGQRLQKRVGIGDHGTTPEGFDRNLAQGSGLSAVEQPD